MTATDWITWAIGMATAIAVGFGIGHWLETRGREIVAEVEAVDPHNLDDSTPTEEPR